MATAGPNSGGTFADDTAVGTNAWGTPGNASASDDARATVAIVTAAPESSYYLKATGFGFAIPGGATIDGITVEIEQSKGNAAPTVENSVKIAKAGVIGGTDKSTAAALTTTDAYVTYGGAADLWGLTWTAADINAATFGAGFSVTLNGATSTGRVDHIRITINYTESAATAKNLRLLGVGA